MNKTRISLGGDPRAFTEFIQLREEISKLTHPARPDVDWGKAEQLCLGLFRNNGIDLQTLAWYTVARVHNTGLAGLAESAELLDALLTYHWTPLWPQQNHVRIDVLAWLSTRLQQELRTLSLSYHDLAQVYCIEQHLQHCCEVLQRIELKILSKLETVALWMHNAALRLEKSGADESVVTTATLFSGSDRRSDPINSATLPPLVFVVKESLPATQSQTPADAESAPPVRSHLWQGFIAGILLTVIATTVTIWATRPPQVMPEIVQRLPSTLTEEQMTSLKQSTGVKKVKSEVIDMTQQQLASLHQLSPLWSREYALTLIGQVKSLWPQDERVNSLALNLQHQLVTEALPDDALQGWYHAQQGLETLTVQLNALDERKGKYLTGSELKSAIFTIRRSLDETPPPEEILRRMEEQQQRGDVAPALYQQLDTRLNQVLNRYALLKQKNAAK